jgi:hypothetical protein
MREWSPAPGVVYHIWYESGAGWVLRRSVKNYGGISVSTALFPLQDTELLAWVSAIGDWLYGLLPLSKESNDAEALQ